MTTVLFSCLVLFYFFAGKHVTNNFFFFFFVLIMCGTFSLKKKGGFIACLIAIESSSVSGGGGSYPIRLFSYFSSNSGEDLDGRGGVFGSGHLGRTYGTDNTPPTVGFFLFLFSSGWNKEKKKEAQRYL